MALNNQLLIHNAKIWSSGKPDNTWMVFDTVTGRVQDVGVLEPPVTSFPDEHRIDCEGKRVLPGLHESHIHVASTGRLLAVLDATGASSIEDFQDKIKRYIEANPTKKWVVGRGWEQDYLGRYPTRYDIDKVSADIPVFLNRICGHIAIANTKALELAGITKDTKDPSGGVIDRFADGHPNAGEPSGILREAPAMRLVSQLCEPTKSEKLEFVKLGVQACLKYGCTAVHSNEDKYWNEYKEVAGNGELPLRVFLAAYFVSGKDSDNFPKPGEKHGEFLSCDRVKIFADGSLGACTAKMSLPYKGEGENYGVLIHTQEELNRYVKDATSAGFRLEIHVIGDAAADAALTAMEAATVQPEKRPILTHCQILRKDLIKRMKKNGVIANIQPQFVTTDARWLSDLLHPDLMQYAYPWKTLLQEGVPCAGGSDAPVETPEPCKGIYDAIFRPVTDRDPQKLVKFRPEECLTVQEAIDLYTKAGAYTAMKEHELGQLQPGFYADFVVFGNARDPVEYPEEFLDAQIQEVWVAGKPRYIKQTSIY